MPVDIQITGLPEVLARLEALGSQAPRALTRALNRTGQSGRTLIVRTLAQDTGLQARAVRPSVALRKATFQRATATLSVTGRRIPLIQLGARQTRAGVSYLGRGGARQVARSAFIAVMRSGHRGVFRRMTRRRLPIRELLGPSLPYVLQRTHLTTIGAALEAALRKNVEHEVAFLLAQGRAQSAETPAESGVA